MSNSTNQSVLYPHLFRLLHWVLTVSFLILVATGLSLHGASRPEWSLFSGVVPPWLWRGRVYLWHYWSAMAFLPCCFALLAYVGSASYWKRATHAILTGGGIVISLTGLWMMFPFGSVGAYKTAVGLHACVGLTILPLGFLWHVIGGLTKHLQFLVPSFRPWKQPEWRRVLWFVPLLAVSSCVMLEGWPWRAPWRNLRAVRTEPSAAADLASLPWDEAAPLAIRLVNGSGFQSGQTELTLRALHDGRELFVMAEWRDPIANFNYCPWRKTDDGWEYLQTSALDETVYYEDKFSLAFPIPPSWHFELVGCAIYCHADGKYGWGYKGGAPDIDIWHWKSVRTDPVGQVDDKYWSLPDFAAKDVGRFGDPAESGGYQKNASDDLSHPAFLPDGPGAQRQGAILAEHAVAYSSEAGDQLPTGSLVPGIIASAFVGDRGDVSCQSRHEQGRWTVYMRRALSTGSPHDVQFAPGSSHSFGCAAFDHAAKRHAYCLPTYRLVLDP